MGLTLAQLIERAKPTNADEIADASAPEYQRGWSSHIQ